MKGIEESIRESRGSEQWAVGSSVKTEMATVRNCRDLVACQKAMGLVKAVYAASQLLPPSELYGLAAQLGRAVVSIPCSIAEGQGRRSTAEFLHYLSIAHASLREAETQLLLAADLGYLQPARVERLMEQAAEVGRLINGLSKSLANR